MSLYHDSGVPVKLYVREEGSSVCAEAKRLSATMTVAVGVRTIDLLHVAAALDRTASGLVSLDHRQCAAARASGLDVAELPA